MPVEVVSYMMAERNASRRLQFQLALQCGPFLKGMKKGSITNIERQDLKELWKILESRFECWRPIRENT